MIGALISTTLGALHAGDPALAEKLDGGIVLLVAVKVVVAFAVLLVAVMLYIWGMRKVIADMQNRIGPANAGPFGVLGLAVALSTAESARPRPNGKPPPH